MGTIAQKLNYLNDAVDDIRAAINEKNVAVDDSVELGYYGDKIRSIETLDTNNIIIETKEFEQLDEFGLNDFYSIKGVEAFPISDVVANSFEEITDL